MKFLGSMHKESSILFGLSPRSFATSDTASFQNRGVPRYPYKGFVHFVETFIVEWLQVWQVFFTYQTKSVCIHVDVDFVFHLRRHATVCDFPRATRFAAKAKTKLNDTGVFSAWKSLFSSFRVLKCFMTILALSRSRRSFSTQRGLMTSLFATSVLEAPCMLVKSSCG